MSSNVYQIITDKITEQLQKGIIPWQKPWTGVLTGAISRSTGRPYSLLNQFLLGKPGEYLTFNQIKEAGGTVRKGEKSHIVVFWKPVKVEEERDGVKKEKLVPMLRYYRVFHIDQCEGVEAKYKPEDLKPADPNQAGEAILDEYSERTGCKIINQRDNRAYYNPGSDEIHLPLRSQFPMIAEYYSTAFHEMIHSTGHPSRLNRIAATAHFGDDSYSKEELVAEIGAAALMNQTGIETKGSFKNSAAYIQSWLRALKNDPRMIVQAASKAEKAVRFILNLDQKQDAESAAVEKTDAEIEGGVAPVGTTQKPEITEPEVTEPTVVNLPAVVETPVVEAPALPEPVIVGDEPKGKRTKGKKTTLASMKEGFTKLIEAAIKEEAPEYLHGAWVDQHGLLCACDGFRAYRFGMCNETLAVPMAPTDQERPDISSVFMPFEKDEEKIRLERPTLSELKGKKSFSFGDGLPTVNVSYLRDVLRMFPDAILSCMKTKPQISPVHFNAPGFGDAIVLPMRPDYKGA